MGDVGEVDDEEAAHGPDRRTRGDVRFADVAAWDSPPETGRPRQAAGDAG